MIDSGEVIHVIERRLFQGDLRRHFIGTVDVAKGKAIRATGYAFVYDSSMDRYERSREPRTRIFPLGSAGLIINVVPATTHVEKVRYVDVDGHLVVSDSEDFTLSINEFGPNY